MSSSSAYNISTRSLIHGGLTDLEAAARYLTEIGNYGFDAASLKTMLDELGQVCDPDVALRNLVGILETPTNTDRVVPIMTDAQASKHLLAVLGASDALGKLMRFRPDLVEAAALDHCSSWNFNPMERMDHMLQAVGPMDENGRDMGGLDSKRYHLQTGDRKALEGLSTPAITLLNTPDFTSAVTQLRKAYRRQLVSIVSHDLCAQDPMAVQPEVSVKLSDLSDAALQASLSIAKRYVPGSERCRFTAIGVGKLGARELNYVSDVDLIYVVEPADQTVNDEQLIRIGSKMAMLLQKICQSAIPHVAEPALWQVDGTLRPEGKDGPLVRRLAAHEQYYQQWAQSWEFQALLKARPVAGDHALGADYMNLIQPLVWQASKRDNFVRDCQEMRKRVEDLIPTNLKDREIKLGRGGLRDVEFTVQMLQLVHGRSDQTLRVSSTLEALKVLAEGGYVAQDQADRLSWDYRFERVLEHRLQIWQMKRTHLFPFLAPVASVRSEKNGGKSNKKGISQNPELRRLARAVHLLPETLVEQYRKTREEVRRLHLDIYYRPMLPINARVGDGQINLSEQATRERFSSIGFADVDAAMRHVQALTEGISRAAKINRFLLPSVLHWLGDGQNPDMGLLHWRRLEEHFGTDSLYLGFLRDSPMAAKRLCHILSNSRFLGEALNKSVESVTWLGSNESLMPRSRKSLDKQCQAIMERYRENANEFAKNLRATRRQEIERIGLAWLSGVIDEDSCLKGMTDVYDAIIAVALTYARMNQCQRLQLDRDPGSVCLIAMGRYGGREANFSSDIDLMAFYRSNSREEGPSGSVRSDARQTDQVGSFALSVVNELKSIVQGQGTTEAKITLDFDLRPEGKNGPLVRSYDSARSYYASWSSIWEHQALLRARWVAGDEALAKDVLVHIVDPLRYPQQPPTEDQVNEIRKLKARMEAERLPRGIHRERHLKLGKGGLSDVEWIVQLMQLQHAGMHPGLRSTSTLAGLKELTRLELLTESDSLILSKAWRMCTAARNGNYLWNGRTSQADIIPDDLESLGGIGVYLGYPANMGQYFENDLMALMRQCREVMERLFYGL